MGDKVLIVTLLVHVTILIIVFDDWRDIYSIVFDNISQGDVWKNDVN
jgi:hypothetical protein